MRSPPSSRSTRGLRARAAFLPLVLGAVALTGCRATVPIGDLLDDPHAYDRRKVKVEGDVEAAAAAFGHGAYLIHDGTGSLVVVAERDGGVPRAGARVAVVGWFRSLFRIGSLHGAVVLERDRDLRREGGGSGHR